MKPVIAAFERDQPWSRPRSSAIEQRIGRRDALSKRLRDEAWFAGAFGASDLMMVAQMAGFPGKPPGTAVSPRKEQGERG